MEETEQKEMGSPLSVTVIVLIIENQLTSVKLGSF